VGWRNIIEKMHMTATLSKWYEEHGRHEIFAGGKNVGLESKDHSLYLRDGIVTQEEQHDLDKLGIAKNAREEKIRARDLKIKASGESANGNGRGPQKNDAAYNARMAALYREVVLKEKPAHSENGFIPLGALTKVNGNGGSDVHHPGEAKPEVTEPVAGD
jgi:7,8-dihydro-6-hydroxymethylpterin dimethyltransferase